MSGATRRTILVAFAACASSAAACGVTRSLAHPTELAITVADLTQCTAKVQESPVTCEVNAVIANAGRAAATLDYSRLLLRDSQGGSYPAVAPTGVATLAGGGSLPVSLSFVIFQSRTPTQLELDDTGAAGGSVTATLTATPSPSPSASPAPATSAPSRPRVAPTSHAAPATSAAPVYVPPPVYAPPPAPPPASSAPPSPVSGGFGNG